MPRLSTILQVFVASPADVPEERTTLDLVISELNRTWSGSLGVTFEILKWETSARPGFDTDPQVVINSQIPADYDVFIGIFWSRIGTPTSRAASGTVEEFELAYSRFKATGSVPEIMLYFKDAPIAPSRIDVDQFAALQTFRNSLSDKGGLFSTFEDQAGFEASVRTHLSAIAQKFARLSEKKDTHTPQCDSQETAINLDDDEYGLLDFLDIYDARMEDMTSAMDVINEATIRIGEQLTQRSTEMPEQNGHDTGNLKKVIKRASEDMFRYANTLESQVTVLTSARQEAFASLSSAIALMADFQTDRERLGTLRESLQGTIAGATSAKNGLLGMRQSVNGLPRLSKDLNKAKRAVTVNLDKLLTEFESVDSTVTNIIEAMDRLLMIHDSSVSGLS